MKVAAVQFGPVFKDFEGNLERMAKLVLQAQANGAELIVLPELSTTGYSFLDAEEAEPFAEPLERGRALSLAIMESLSRNYSVAIAWGFVEKDIATGKLHNSQAIVLPDGKFYSYRKINKWGNDYLWAESGEASPPVVEFRGKKVGLLICRDIRDKSAEWKDFYEKGDADIVAFSSNFGDGGFPAVSWVEFATSNEVHLIVSNRYGQEENNDFGEGGICVIDPKGKVTCKGLQWSAPCIVYADVP